MNLQFSKKFAKQRLKLTKGEKLRVKKILRLFEQCPRHPLLKNHKLKGPQEGRRAISAGGDLRLIFEEYENYTLVLFLSVGSHNQVY